MDDDLERIVNEAIAEYGRSEPLAGMDGRILARIGTAQQSQRRWMGWKVAASVAAAGIAVVALLPRHEAARPTVRAVTVDVRPAQADTKTAAMIYQPLRQRHRKHVEALAKLAVFPTPTPLTAEERMLIALFNKDPQGTAEAFQSLRKKNEPIEIAPLVIQPLETGAGQ